MGEWTSKFSDPACGCGRARCRLCLEVMHEESRLMAASYLHRLASDGVVSFRVYAVGREGSTWDQAEREWGRLYYAIKKAGGKYLRVLPGAGGARSWLVVTTVHVPNGVLAAAGGAGAAAPLGVAEAVRLIFEAIDRSRSPFPVSHSGMGRSWTYVPDVRQWVENLGVRWHSTTPA